MKIYFEIYIENLNCKLSELSCIEGVSPSLSSLSLSVQEKLDAIGTREERLLTSQDTADGDISTHKSLKTKLTAGGKVKASHKIRAQTSRIVSSFKAQSVVSSVVHDYCGHKDGVWQVSTKYGQPIIGTASADHTACIWGIDSGRCLLQYQGHGGSVNSIKFHQSKDLVLTASGDGTAHIWQGAVNWEAFTR